MVEKVRYITYSSYFNQSPLLIFRFVCLKEAKRPEESDAETEAKLKMVSKWELNAIPLERNDILDVNVNSKCPIFITDKRLSELGLSDA